MVEKCAQRTKERAREILVTATDLSGGKVFKFVLLVAKRIANLVYNYKWIYFNAKFIGKTVYRSLENIIIVQINLDVICVRN